MQKVNIYDPFTRAYREVSAEDARKFIASAKEAEKKLGEGAEEGDEK